MIQMESFPKFSKETADSHILVRWKLCLPWLGWTWAKWKTLEPWRLPWRMQQKRHWPRFTQVWIRWKQRKQHFSRGPCGLAVIEKSLRRDISQEFDNKRIEAGQGPGRRHRLSQLYRSLYEFVWNGLVTVCLVCVSLCQISSFHCILRPSVFGPWPSLVGWFHPPMMH